MQTSISRTPAPDVWQIGVVIALLFGVTLPLLPYLHISISSLVLTVLAWRTAILRWPWLQPNKWLLGILAIVGLVVVAASYLALAGQDAGTAFLLTMMALKTLEIRTDRDIYILATLFSFLLVTAFLFDSSPLFAFYLALLLFGSVIVLADISYAPSRTLPYQFRIAQHSRRTLIIVLQALPLAVILFFLFPRLETPLWSLGFSAQRAFTGMSNQLELGQIGELVTSGEIAFHARFTQPLPVPASQLYWRGPVLWRTNGKRWEPLNESLLKTSQMRVVANGDIITYNVILEPTAQRWLFALDLPLAAPAQTQLLTADSRLLADEPISEVRAYQLQSALSYYTVGLSESERALALQVPNSIPERTRALAMQWRTAALQTASDATDITPAIVQTALRYFYTEPFYYTLQPPPLLGSQPIDQFLFVTRAGFCEHYASSFALLMRLAGVPARIVLGYLGAEYNPIGGHYLVRQSDAHAWAEVWIEKRGWVRIDPTTAIPPERINADASFTDWGIDTPLRFRLPQTGAARWLYQMRLFTDAIDAGWKNWVVGFSTKRQQHLLDALGLSAWRETGLIILMLIGGALLMAVVHVLLTRVKPERDPVLRCYLQLCRKLARIGYARQATEGPRDYLMRVAQARPDLAPALARIQALYLPLRFNRHYDHAQQLALQQLVRALHPTRHHSPSAMHTAPP